VDRARIGIDLTHQDDEGIGAGVYRSLASVIELLAEGDVLQLGPVDQLFGALVRRLAGQRFLHASIAGAQDILHFA